MILEVEGSNPAAGTGSDKMTKKFVHNQRGENWKRKCTHKMIYFSNESSLNSFLVAVLQINCNNYISFAIMWLFAL
jgi:hypothetical protein